MTKKKNVKQDVPQTSMKDMLIEKVAKMNEDFSGIATVEYNEDINLKSVETLQAELKTKIDEIVNKPLPILPTNDEKTVHFVEWIREFVNTFCTWDGESFTTESGEEITSYAAAVKFDEDVTNIIDKLKSGELNELTFDIMTLGHTIQSIKNCAGVGIDSAKKRLTFDTNYGDWSTKTVKDVLDAAAKIAAERARAASALNQKGVLAMHGITLNFVDESYETLVKFATRVAELAAEEQAKLDAEKEEVKPDAENSKCVVNSK